MKKTAVCISGKVNSIRGQVGLSENLAKLRTKFPGADFFFATWKSERETFESSFPELVNSCLYVDEPVIEYHPYLGIVGETSKFYKEEIEKTRRSSKDKIQWKSHHTKQILIHSLLLDACVDAAKYDVVVRARFDSYVTNRADFTPFIEETRNSGKVNGFGITRWNDRTKCRMMYHTESNDLNNSHSVYLLDQCIIHQRSRIDTDRVWELHRAKRLLAAEFGWCQILSEPWGRIHTNNHGFINHDKHILFDEIEK